MSEGAEYCITCPSAGWRCLCSGEDTVLEDESLDHTVETPTVENPEECVLWYFNYFLGKKHHNYLAADEVTGEVFGVSILKEETHVGDLSYKVIVWTVDGVEKQMFQCKARHAPSTMDIVRKAAPKLQFKKLKEIESLDILQDFKELEASRIERNYKIGMLLAKEGQTKEDEFYQNCEGSERYHEFLKLIGNEVELKQFKGYRGGLDVTNNATGTHSYYTNWMDYQVMFHVSTMLPYAPEATQQIERKRHIGNDIVIVIFYDVDPNSNTDFIPWEVSSINSKFNHIIALVRPDGNDNYKLEIVLKDTIANFGPTMPFPAVFPKHSFKQFLMAKLVNGQRAALHSAPSFTVKLQRTFKAHLQLIFEKYYAAQQTSTVPNYLANKRRSASYTNHHISKGNELRAKEFASGNLGLKETSKSLNIFETDILFSKAFDSINCVDVIESDGITCNLIFATTDGIYIFKNGTSSNESSSCYQRVARLKGASKLTVVPALNIVLVLTPKGLHMFDLEELQQEYTHKCTRRAFPDAATANNNEPTPKRLEHSKGCTVFAMSKLRGSKSPDSESLAKNNITLLYVALKKTLLMFEWHNGEFHKSKEMQAHDAIKTVCALAPGMVCIGLAKEFLLFDMYTGVMKELYKKADSEPVRAMSLDTEIFLCFNNIGFFVDERGVRTRNYEIKWGSIPKAIVLSPHYILGVSGQLLEIRTLVNGNIIQSLPTFQTSNNGISTSSSSSPTLESQQQLLHQNKVNFSIYNDMTYLENGNIYVATSYQGTSCIVRVSQQATGNHCGDSSRPMPMSWTNNVSYLNL
ncbi:hypothetical protein SAMD00019534_040820 [Acytostelium subglobosum LB1]|uniref:hypothetical protein n=1 Tax=Acytostelium subglobosum LB1 TaxID=1410327 RepID=UPI000644E79E|nr:hypothetical protein SAMD00019534_040820 [Acytostelium subglobosum LB1]GAM20907.1 hypothetical protein SAMD00019534_040820 [Acytostelium subglobosum LB1]|eukprot:XP_012756041.1 hypothetical protein SAMD00019534_040820 [Acytostelium subglobosum LB1]